MSKISPPSAETSMPVDLAEADAVSRELCRRVKALRAERGWSLDVLSQACGVSRSMLSEIERERANPTLAVAARIALAFDLSLGELVESRPQEDEIVVIRAEDRGSVFRDDGQVRIRTLSPLQLEKDVEFYELVLQSGAELRSLPHYNGTREFLTVEKGRLIVESGESQVALARGDSARYKADVPHCIRNPGKNEAVAFLVDIYS